ncbi:MAG TPA: hypothetical protein VNT58_06880 [Gaiellaceae bacterium]|nr:hypothetical protein [Gaiellaceae bacterium]
MDDDRPAAKPAPAGLSTILLVFAAVDLILALLLLLAGGFSWQFWAIAAIGVGLAIYAARERLRPAPPA